LSPEIKLFAKVTDEPLGETKICDVYATVAAPVIRFPNWSSRFQALKVWKITLAPLGATRVLMRVKGSIFGLMPRVCPRLFRTNSTVSTRKPTSLRRAS